jgi:predicted O-linked N-acetylglucosamine transferase (SPINDLY family)
MSRFDDAASALRKTVALRPNYAAAWNNLGNALAESKRHAEAIDAYRKAIEIEPGLAEAHNNLGVALQQLGQLDEAIESYQQSLRLRPGNAGAHYHLSNALKEKGEIERAEAEIRAALSLQSDYAEAWITLAALLADQNRWEESLDAARRAIDVRPNWPGGYNNLGLIFRTRGQHAEALGLFRQALARDPKFREALVNVGTALLDMGKLDEAIEAYEQALHVYPDLIDAYLNIGNALKDAGRVDEAIQKYRDALAIKDSPVAADNLLMALSYSPTLSAQEILEEHLKWGERCASAESADYLSTQHPALSTQSRLRIGYVSPDFRRHVVGWNILPMMERHDRSRFEMFLYANVGCPDYLTERFRRACDAFHNVKGLSDQRMAQLVRDDRIDILVDLAVHSSGNRLRVFAFKPAPVQVTWAGYPGTTGLKQIDYRLSDPFLDPPSKDGGLSTHEEFYSEGTFRLPDSFWCYQPYVDPPGVSPLPALSNGYVTFGCLNAFCKTNPRVFELWSKVLVEFENSKMLLLSRPGSHLERTLSIFQSHGVPRSRIEFVDYQPMDQYLRTYHRIDIGLDTFPYNGHTTSLEALWMGVPVVTLVGETAVSRAGWCQLNNIGLGELAAHDDRQFVEIASGLATDLTRLAELRAGLRQRMEHSPLMDFERFTRNIEMAYRTMWRNWYQAVREK